MSVASLKGANSSSINVWYYVVAHLSMKKDRTLFAFISEQSSYIFMCRLNCLFIKYKSGASTE